MTTPMRIGDYEVSAGSRTASGVRYLATHALLPRRAIIEVREIHAGQRTNAVRLLRQACIVEALHHPAVPRIYECGTLEGHIPWVAFERIEGATLETELREHVLTVDEVLDLLEGIADVLAHAHARGVLHRDITPAYIVREAAQRGCPLVLEGWGSCCTLDTELRTPLRGNNHYRAPEVQRDGIADGKADVFALGAIAREALLGDSPTHPLAQRASGLPSALRNLLVRMTAVEPAHRPAAAEVAAELEHLRTSRTPVVDTALVDADTEPVVLLERVRKPRWTPNWASEPPPPLIEELDNPRSPRSPRR